MSAVQRALLTTGLVTALGAMACGGDDDDTGHANGGSAGAPVAGHSGHAASGSSGRAGRAGRGGGSGGAGEGGESGAAGAMGGTGATTRGGTGGTGTGGTGTGGTGTGATGGTGTGADGGTTSNGGANVAGDAGDTNVGTAGGAGAAGGETSAGNGGEGGIPPANGGTTTGSGGSGATGASGGTGGANTAGTGGAGLGGTGTGTGGSDIGGAGLGGTGTGTGGSDIGGAGLGGSAGSGGGSNIPSDCLGVTPDGDDTLAVASSGVLPFANVQSAIDFADAHRSGAIKVCVARGFACDASATYAGPSGSDLAMKNGISVYGEYESTTWTRCTLSGTTLEPGTGRGVYFGPDIVSPTLLDRFIVRPFPATTTAAVTIDGAQGGSVNVELAAPAAASTTLYGIDASNGTTATVHISSNVGNTTFHATHIVGLHAVGATLHASVSLTFVAPDATDVVGAWLDQAGGSDVSAGLVFFTQAAVVGVHASNSPNLVLGNSSVRVFPDVGLPSTFVGAELENDPGVTWTSGVLSISSQKSGTCNGILLHASPGATISPDITVSGQAGPGEAIAITGSAAGTNVSSAVTDNATTPTAAISVGDCGGEELSIGGSVTAAASASFGQGILVNGNCAPTIGADVTVKSPGTSVAQTLTGIRCSGAAHCTLDGATVGITGANTLPGAAISATGVSCDSGSCPVVRNSTISGLSQAGELRNSRYGGAGLVAPGAALISGNFIFAGCSGGNGTGLVGSGRIENNLIAGPTCGGSFLDSPLSQARGLSVAGAADVHSNTIYGGGATDGFGVGQTGCSSIGAIFGDGATFRNNIIQSSICQQNYAVQRNTLFNAPQPFEHNDLYPGGSVLFVDDSTPLTSVSAVNSLPGASGNFAANPALDSSGHLTSGSPCIDAGTSTGAPATDRDGDPRDATPDVGADEGTVCDTGNGGCDPRTVCTPFTGGRTCGPCPNGFTGDGATGCLDVDECQLGTDDCPAPSTCVNVPGAWTCECPAGYVFTAGACVDIDECQSNDSCAPAACINTDGGFECGACPPGYTGTGETGCSDIDECATDDGGCDELFRYCVNEVGSHRCGSCLPGYSDEGPMGCVADPCLFDHGGCDAHATCTNDGGVPVCGPCPAGYTGDGTSGCTDIDECAVPDICDSPFVEADFYCTNLPGSYGCNLCPGFTKQGCSGLCPAFSCENGGTCVGGTTCNCPPGVGGAHCEDL